MLLMTLQTRSSLTPLLNRLWTIIQSFAGTMITESFRKRRLSDTDEVSASHGLTPCRQTIFVGTRLVRDSDPCCYAPVCWCICSPRLFHSVSISSRCFGNIIDTIATRRLLIRKIELCASLRHSNSRSTLLAPQLLSDTSERL